MVRRPPPISLRIRSAEASQLARGLLLRLSEEELQWQATKASISISEMASIAAAKLDQMSARDRDRWRAECKQVQAFLEKIKARGI